jgi:hypothetical protein
MLQSFGITQSSWQVNENSDRKNMTSFRRVKGRPEFAQRWLSYFCVKQQILEWTSHFFTKCSEKSWINSLWFYELYYFYSFTEDSGIIFTTSACLWMIQWLLPISVMILLTQAINLQCFLVTDCSINADTNAFIRWHPLFFEIRVNHVKNIIVWVFKGLQNNSSSLYIGWQQEVLQVRQIHRSIKS